MKRETILGFLEFLADPGPVSGPGGEPPPANVLWQAALARYTKGGEGTLNSLNRALARIVSIFADDGSPNILMSTSEEAFNSAGVAIGEIVVEASKVDYCIEQLALRNVAVGVAGERIVNLVAPSHTISHAWQNAQYFCKQPYSESAVMKLRDRIMGSRFTTDNAKNVINDTIADAHAQAPIRLLRMKYLG